MVNARPWRPPTRLRRLVRVATPENGSLAEPVISFLPYRGRRVAYAVSGAGPPLLLDVGRAHHLEVFWSYPPYRRLVQGLSRRFTVVRWDRPGCGLSDRGPPELSPEADVGLVERLVTFLGAAEVTVVAAGDAGPTMVRFAAGHPEHVVRLALFGTAAAPTLVPASDATLALLSGSSAQAIHDVVAAAQAATCEADVGAWLAAAFEAAADVPAMVELVRASADPGALLHAGRVRAPTLVLRRSGDPVVEAAAARALASRIPDATFGELDGRCHLLYACDTEAVLAALLPFLCGAGAGPPPALSCRELEVAAMVTLGLANVEIGTRLGIRRRTVEAHLEHIRAKLRVNSRAQIAVWFTRSRGDR